MHKKVVAAAFALLASLQVLPAVAHEGARSRLIRHPIRWSAGAQKALPDVTEGPRDALTKALASGRLTEAEYALHRARSLFAFRSVSKRFGSVARPDVHLATIYLRDLALRLDELSGDDATAARALLARPTAGGSFRTNAQVVQHHVCGANLCFHWETGSSDAPPAGDSDVDGIPDQVEATQAAFEAVYAAEVTNMGYRPPLTDQIGPDSPTTQLDVYLSDLGADGIYGFCTVAEEPTSPGVPAFCGVDNDFSQSQFPGAPQDNLNVTSGHEFFHAIQFGYDVFEDLWMLEGTAVWMEDELFTDVNDNYQYLPGTPLAAPELPIDFASFSSNPTTAYDSWIWWRFLSEYFGDASGHNQDIVREVWERADGVGSAPDDYSMKALANVLSSNGTNLKNVFADFGAIAYIPDAFFEEGVAYLNFLGGRINAPSAKLTRSRPVANGTFKLDHMSNQFAVLKPGKGIASNAKLKVKFNFPPSKRGSMASLLVIDRNGSVDLVGPSLDSDGDGSVKKPFGKGTIDRIVVVMTNASSRYQACGSGLPVACGGLPKDDGLKFLFKAKVIQ